MRKRKLMTDGNIFKYFLHFFVIQFTQNKRMNYISRRQVNRDKLYQYFEASTWILYLIPHLWTEIRSPSILQKAGITPQVLKSQEQWFWDYCCYNGYIRPDFYDIMTNEQKFIFQFITNIIEKNHQKQRRKGMMDTGFQAYQQQIQKQQSFYLQNIQAYDYQNANFYYQQHSQQEQEKKQRELEVKSEHEQNSSQKQNNDQEKDHKNENVDKKDQDAQTQNNKNQIEESVKLQIQDNGQNVDQKEIPENKQIEVEKTLVQHGKQEENKDQQNETQVLTPEQQIIPKPTSESQIVPSSLPEPQIILESTSEPQILPQPIQESQILPQPIQESQILPQPIQESQILPQPIQEPQIIPKSIPDLKPEIIKISLEDFQKMIQEATEATVRAEANPQLIQEIDKITTWETSFQEFHVVSDQNTNKKGGDFQKGKNYHPSDNGDFKRGCKFNKSKDIVPLKVGGNQSYHTIYEKNQLKARAASVNYAKKKQQEESMLNEIDKAKREINFDLNRIAPENLEDIAKQLAIFAKQQKEICVALVRLIIEKAWEQPRYAASYANLSYKFTKIKQDQFLFEAETLNNKKGYNSFKYFLMEEVQNSFDEQQIKFPEFADYLEKDDFLRKLKKKMIGNVKFIAELIKSKVLNKKIIRCILHDLIKKFLTEYYTFVQEETPESSIYYFQFEVIIEFLQSLGEKFEEITDQKEQKKKSFYKEVEAAIIKLSDGQTDPEKVKIQQVGLLSADEFFCIFQVIDKYILSKKHGRISALLQNLEERRENGWKKHHVQAEGPKKLKDLAKQEEQEFSKPEQKVQISSIVLDEKMKKLLSNYVDDDEGWRKIYNELIKGGLKKSDIYSCYMRLVAEDKKDLVAKRLEIFNVFLEQKFNYREFKEGWKKAVEQLTFQASDMPFCGAALCKILLKLRQKHEVKFEEFFIKFDEDEQEDEFWFMMQIYQKLYHYSQNDEILTFVQAKPKLSHLL